MPSEPNVQRSAEPWVPHTTSLRALSTAAHECRGCDLYKHATHGMLVAGLKVVASLL